MNPLKILIGLFVWLISISTAYFIGFNFNPAEVADYQPSPKTSIQSSQRDEQMTRKTKGKVPTVTPGSIMALSEGDLDEALRQADDLSLADRQALLAEAFALPVNDHRRGRMIRSLLSQLAETAPQEALAMAKDIGSLRETERARISILEVWAQNDPATALAWAKTGLADLPLRSKSSHLLAIYRGYAQTNPKAAFTAAMTMPDGTSGDRRIQTFALEEIINEQIENGGLYDAKLQVELMKDGPMKDQVLSELVNEWAEFDPEGAAAYVESLGENAPSSVKARLLGEWAENDPEAAAAWLSQREVDEETLSRASTAIIREWTRYDMAASAEWLNSQPSSPALDRAVMSYTYQAASEDPASAMTWAESIDNNWMRTRMMRHVAGSWKSDDPEAFQEYLDQAELDEEQKKSLIEAEEVHGGRRWWR